MNRAARLARRARRLMRRRGPPPGFPPGPNMLRTVQTLGFMFRPVKYIGAQQRRYGDIVTFSTLFDSRFVMLFEPELVKQVFQGPHEQLNAGEANAVLGFLLGNRSVLLLDGKEHLRQRKLMLPSFHGERMRAYEDVIRAAADDAIDSWPVGRPFELLPSMQELTLEVIMRAVFGMAEGERLEELKRRVRAVLAPTSQRNTAALIFGLSGRQLPGARNAMADFEEKRRRMDELLYEEIADRRAATDVEEREDVFSTLLLARDEEGEPMTDQELRDELVTLLLAGHETTATALAWAFDLLLHDQRVLAKLRESLAAGEDSYVDAVAKETLRARPVIAGVGRVVRGEPFELGGYKIPPGTEINPSISFIHRRKDRFPQPQEFRPERFLEDDPPDTYTWIPFGGGPRRCLGASFALFEMRVAIKRILERSQLAPARRKLDEIERRTVTMSPRNNVRVFQSERPAPASAVPGAGTPATAG